MTNTIEMARAVFANFALRCMATSASATEPTPRTVHRTIIEEMLLKLLVSTHTVPVSHSNGSLRASRIMPYKNITHGAATASTIEENDALGFFNDTR